MSLILKDILKLRDLSKAERKAVQQFSSDDYKAIICKDKDDKIIVLSNLTDSTRANLFVMTPDEVPSHDLNCIQEVTVRKGVDLLADVNGEGRLIHLIKRMQSACGDRALMKVL